MKSQKARIVSTISSDSHHDFTGLRQLLTGFQRLLRFLELEQLSNWRMQLMLLHERRQLLAHLLVPSAKLATHSLEPVEQVLHNVDFLRRLIG